LEGRVAGSILCKRSVREEPIVAPECVPRADSPEDRLDPGVSVVRPVAAVPVSSSPIDLWASPSSNLKVGFGGWMS
jgi:hypothetical protein